MRNNSRLIFLCGRYAAARLQHPRTESRFVTGVSTRGAIALYKAAQVTAAFDGRDYVLPEDVRAVAPAVLCHRISAGASVRAEDVAEYLEHILDGTEVPLEELS